MTQNEVFFLLLVCATFAAFGVGVAANYVRYRTWLSKRPNEPTATR